MKNKKNEYKKEILRLIGPTEPDIMGHLIDTLRMADKKIKMHGGKS